MLRLRGVSERRGPTPLVMLILVVLVVVLSVLIHKINTGEHHTPQAYYRRKTGGAPVAGGYEALGPRRRKRPDEDLVERSRTT
jgi:hypothetical protein